MPLATSGAMAFSTINGYYGWGNHMSQYAGRTYYNSGGAHVFPTSNFAMSTFRGTAPTNEWACACDCNCNCACASDCACACGK